MPRAGEAILILCILGFVVPLALTMTTAANSTPAPFIIYGWVYYENGSACTNPQVNITNLNTSATRQAETNLSDNYYQLVLASGTDVNATERLQVQASRADSEQARHVICTVSTEDVARGGLLPYNISLTEPGRQTWYFTTNEADGPRSALATYNKTMTKGVEGGDEIVTLAPGECVWFYADELANCMVPFPAGTWDVRYWVIASGSGTLSTRLQNLTPGGGNTTIAENTSSITDTAGALQEIDLALATASFSVPTGGRFAIALCWPASATGSLEIYCNPPEQLASSVTSPSADPGYPVPELPSLLLLCAGVLTLAGYLALHRRRRARE
jgi:hypothetical protein